MEPIYTGANLDVLKDLEPLDRRAWQLLYEGDIPNDVMFNFDAELEAIFERMPELPSLTLHLEGGLSTAVRRDFPSDVKEEVDRAVRKILREHSAVLGITFPAHGNYSEHCATRQEPSWSPYYKASASVLARFRKGEIGEEEAIELLREISRPEDNTDAFTSVRLEALRRKSG